MKKTYLAKILIVCILFTHIFSVPMPAQAEGTASGKVNPEIFSNWNLTNGGSTRNLAGGSGCVTSNRNSADEVSGTQNFGTIMRFPIDPKINYTSVSLSVAVGDPSYLLFGKDESEIPLYLFVTDGVNNDWNSESPDNGKSSCAYVFNSKQNQVKNSKNAVCTSARVTSGAVMGDVINLTDDLGAKKLAAAVNEQRANGFITIVIATKLDSLARRVRFSNDISTYVLSYEGVEGGPVPTPVPTATPRPVDNPIDPSKIIRVELQLSNPTAKVNGADVALAQPAITQNDRTLVPVRFVSESFGALVFWDEKTWSVTIYGNGNKMVLKIDDPVVLLNDLKVTLDQPAIIYNERTMLPARFVAENLGAVVKWDEATQTVTMIRWGTTE